MPQSWTPGGNYDQNQDYRAVCRRAAEDRAINRAAAAKKRRPKSINPNSLPTGKWELDALPRAALPRTGKTYPYSSAKRQGRKA